MRRSSSAATDCSSRHAATLVASKRAMAGQPVALSAAAKAPRASSISAADTTSGGIQRRTVLYVPADIRMRRPSCRQWAAIGRRPGRVVELDGDHQAEPAHLADAGVVGLQLAQPGRQLLAAGDDVVEEPRAVTTSIVASAAAHPIGLPPYVPPWLPFGHRSSSSRRVPRADSGKPEAIPLAMQMMSGSTP